MYSGRTDDCLTIHEMAMLWTDTKTLALIEEYKKRPCLWDHSDEYNKTVSKKNDAWFEIAEVLQFSVTEIKRKIASLLASFRRERKKSTGSTWFAYNHLSFLLGNYGPKTPSAGETGEGDDSAEWWIEHEGLTEADILNNSDIEDKPEIHPEIKENFSASHQYLQANPLGDADDSISLSIPRRTLTVSRKRAKLERPIEYYPNEDYHVPQRTITVPTKPKTVSELFIAYLSAKLDTYSEYEKNVVQHKINEILFQADIGMYAKTNVSKDDSGTTNGNS